MHGVPFIRGGLAGCALLLLAVSFLPCAFAQRYHVHTYTESSGLPASEIRSIAQGADGVMWFGTRGGLVGYDGRSWSFHHIEGEGSRFDQAQLRVDSGGKLWTVSTVAPFLVSCFDGQSWTRLPRTPVGKLPSNATGLVVHEHEGGVRVIVSDSVGELHFWDGLSWRRNAVTGARGAISIRAMAVGGGRLLMATEFGLLQLELDALEGVARPCPELPRGPVYALATEAQANSLWVVGGNWIGRMTRDGFVMEDVENSFDSLRRSVSTSAVVDASGGLYFGDVDELFYYHAQSGLETLGRRNGLVGAGVSALFMDRESNVWAASAAGLSKIVSRRFANFTREHGLLEDDVSAVFERRSGEIVIGHDGGVTFIGREMRTMSFSRPLVTSRVLEIAEESDGTLWLAANHWGAIRIDPDGAQRTFAKEDGLTSSISGVLVARDGTVWVCGAHGIHRWTGRRFERVGLIADGALYVRRLMQASDGTIYGTTYHHGVFRLRNGALDGWYRGSSSAEDSSYSLHEDTDGTIWVTTHGGPRVVRAGQILPMERPRAELDQPVYFVLRDTREALWFGTGEGAYRLTSETLEQISPVHGLAGNETSRAAGIVDRQGRVWIGSDRGVSVYARTFDHGALVAPELLLGGIEAGGSTFASDEEFTVPADSSGLVVRFGVVSFDDERRVRFRVRMEGLDEEWSEFESLSQWVIHYRMLPRGVYRFQIQAIDVDGVMSEIASSAEFTVPGPLWSRPWVMALVALSLLVLASGVVAFVLQRRNARLLEREVSDRTEQLRVSEQSLRVERERLSTILESLREGVAVTDDRGLLRSFNPSAERISGWIRDEALGVSIEEVLGRGWGELAGGGEAAGRSSGGLVERRAFLRDGRECWLEASVAPLEDGGRQGLSSVWVFRDVTARRQVEGEALRAQKLESLGVLAGGIAHDFNNLLTILIGNLRLLDGLVTLEEPYDRLIADASDASRRAQNLTRQLLTFSKGGAPLREALQVEALIREISSLCYSGSNVACSLDLEEGLWPVMADPSQFEQVISNLLINARQAMPDGGIVRVTARNLPSGAKGSRTGRTVSIEVHDEGIGIPEKDLGVIFDPYFTTKEQGHGLGLAIVYSVVCKHGGRLTVESVPGKGSVFRVLLPATGELAGEDVREKGVLQHEEGRILIMDDEEHVRSVLSRSLERSGFEVQESGDGEDAVRAYRAAMRNQERFDLVLMDMTVPGGMGGLEAVQLLREIDPEVRAVVISGYSDDPVLAEPQRYGFSAALAKPFQPDRLVSLVSKLLRAEPAGR